MIYPIARLPDRWVDQAREEGAHVDFTLKSPWKLFCDFDGNTPKGFIGLLLHSNTRCTIRGWYVFPDQRGRGVGTGLLGAAISWASEQGFATIEIRTAHNVEWAGFEWTGYQREGGNQERHFTLKIVQPPLPGLATNSSFATV